ncbi:hypothetical protein PG985_016304 [Apiospora marii]|uniref:uncharacterized protein n=1 Tax=Apiospora marii TaxID=335849 RepID=UPI003130FB6F
MDSSFDISPEKRAGKLHFIYRQLCVQTPQLSTDHVNLEGKRAIVTGSNMGLGLETARQLLRLGAAVVLAVRDTAKGEDARRQLVAGDALLADRIEVWELDMSSYESMVGFVGRVRASAPLDILVLNAGVFNCHEAFAPTGYEQVMQINYLSTALLTLMLLPILQEQRLAGHAPARVVWVTSDMAAWASFQERTAQPLLPAFREPMGPKWDMADRYGTSKLLGQLFLTELVRHVQPGTTLVTCANPGLCHGSGLGRQSVGWLRLGNKVATRLLGRTCTVGARPIVHAATLLDEKAHGQYIEDGKLQPMPPIVYTPEGQSIARRLYEETLSELALVQAAHPGKAPTGSAVERATNGGAGI